MYITLLEVVTVSGCSFLGNSAAEAGGGIFCNSSLPAVSDSAFSSNSARFGGAFCSSGGSAVFDRCTFTGDQSTQDGGAVYLNDYARPVFAGCTFSGARATGNGGAVGGEMGISPTFTSCLFDDCQATSAESIGGIGCLIGGNDVAFDNCLLVNGRAQGGAGGVYVSVGTYQFRSCTVAGNESAGEGGGLSCGSSADVSIRDSILYSNVPDSLVLQGGTVEVTYSDVEGGWAGTGNIDQNPQFEEGPWPIAGGYYLETGSPCVDAGSDLAGNITFSLPEGELQMDQVTTRVDCVPDATESLIDLGYHYPVELPTPTVTATATPTPTSSATQTMSPSVTPSPTGTATTPLTLTPSATATGTVTQTAIWTATPTMSMTATFSQTPTVTRTPTIITVALAMPAQSFQESDACYLKLFTGNDGGARAADLYVLLDVFGAYWCYPSWELLDFGLDHEAVTVPTGSSTLMLIPEFTMPAVSPCGPLYFYAAMFEPGTLSLETLVSNGAIYQFYLE